MNTTNFLESRRSVRVFKEGHLNGDVISNIKNVIDIVSKEDESKDIEFEIFYDDSFKVYNGLKDEAGYSGVMIKAPAYISLAFKNSNPITRIYGSYQMEKMISKFVELGLDICWVTLGTGLTEGKYAAFGEAGEHIEFLLAIGYAEAKKPFTPEATSGRKAVNEIVFSEKPFQAITTNELEDRGLLDLFSAIRYAPSHGNRQPWRFVIGAGDVRLYIKSDEDFSLSLTAAGIIMYYFYELASGMGLNSGWVVEDSFDEVVDGYALVAKYEI